jgi:hypothetical protein
MVTRSHLGIISPGIWRPTRIGHHYANDAFTATHPVER